MGPPRSSHPSPATLTRLGGWLRFAGSTVLRPLLVCQRLPRAAESGLPLRAFASLLCVLSLMSALSCNRQNEVRNTIPADGATGVDPETVVAIRISNTFTEADMDNTDAANWVVEGDLSSTPYSGTISFAEWNQDVFPGQTTDEFEGSSSPVSSPGEGENGVPEFSKDALVFELSDGASFKDGETISVFVKHDITAHGSPVDHNEKFSFRVGATIDARESLSVIRTDPDIGARGVALQPRVSVGFNRAVGVDDLADGVLLRGTQSGAPADEQITVTQSEGAEGALEIAVRPPAGTAFLPGETVDLTLASTIREAVSDEEEPVALTPFLLRFHVASGRVQDGWTPVDLPGEVPSAVQVVAAELNGDSAGVEFVVLSTNSLHLFRQSDPGVWLQAQMALSNSITLDGRLDAVDAVAYDSDSDGRAEIVVLLSGDAESRLQIFSVDDDGDLESRGTPVDFPFAAARRLSLADLDASGKPELLVAHAGATEPVLFELLEEALDVGSIDITDPSSFLPMTGFSRIDAAVPALGPATRLEAVDLNLDGKLDLIAEGSDGLLLYENLGTARTQFALRESRLLARSGATLSPRAWAVTDLDGDGDADVLLVDDQGTLLFENDERLGAGLLGDGALSAGPLSLDVDLASATELSARDLDGDGLVDLVALRGDGRVDLLLARDDEPFRYDFVRLEDGAGTPAGLVIADVDGDEGLDVISLAGTTVRLGLSEGVTPPASGAEASFEIFATESGVREDLLEVVVRGTFDVRFSGYTLALEYDEDVLTYSEFVSPEDFAGVASFTPCPDAQQVGCAGAAAVTMVYNANTQGALPSADVLLGTFLFEVPQVDAEVITRIELMGFDADGEEFRNTARISESGDEISVPARIVGVPFDAMFAPLPPPTLVASCEVLERVESSLLARVTWSSPAGASHAGFEVLVDGVAQPQLGGGLSELEFSTEAQGEFPVVVRGLDADGAELSRASCDLVGIHRPVVACEALGATLNRLEWTLHDVDETNIYRNGERLSTRSGGARTFDDTDSNPVGGDLYEVAGVIDGIEGPRGACGPVGDSNTGVTTPVSLAFAGVAGRPQSGSPTGLRVAWSNGEGYDSLNVRIERVDTGVEVLSEDLSGTATEFSYDGDLDTGGVPPGEYRLGVTALRDGIASEPVLSETIRIAVPRVEGNFLCSLGVDGSLTVVWDRVWAGYDSLTLLVEHRIDGVLAGGVDEVPLPLDATTQSLTARAPLGMYRFELRAEFSRPVPADLLPPLSALSAFCELDFNPSLRIGPVVDAGVGVERVELPIVADVAGALSGFEFSLEFPDFFDVDPASGLEVVALGGTQDFELGAGESPGTRRANVTVRNATLSADPDGDGVSGGPRVIARLVGSVPLDFTLPEQSELRFIGPATVRFAESQNGGTEDASVETTDGILAVHRRFVSIDRVEVAASSNEVIPLAVRTTFNAPAPGYVISAVTLHFRWDPEELELLEFRSDAQAGSALAERGLLIEYDSTDIALARNTGEAVVGWLGFDLSNPGESGVTPLEPGNDTQLIVLHFESKLPPGTPTTFSSVEFLSGSGVDQPTIFAPQFDVAGEPDLQGFLGGGVLVVGEAVPLGLESLSPGRGSFLGGHQVTLTGTGFSAVPPDALSVDFLVDGDTNSPLRVDEILQVSGDRIRFVVPDSGRRVASVQSFNADVRLTVDNDEAVTLPGAYLYEPPELVTLTPNGGPAGGGDLVSIRGAGLPPSAEVQFRFADVATPFPALVTQVADDGTEVRVVSPDLSGQEGKVATIEVAVPGIGNFALVEAWQVTAGMGNGMLSITSLDTVTGSICGGDSVTLRGTGFVGVPEVTFGGAPSPLVELIATDTARVTTPAVLEDVTVVDVEIRIGAATAALPGAFRYRQTAPEFLRGDTDGSGSLNVVDAVRLTDLLFGRSSVFPPNLDALDTNDDGVLDGGDVTTLLELLANPGSGLPLPFGVPGFDPTPDSLDSCP